MHNHHLRVSSLITAIVLLSACSDGEPVMCSQRSNVYAGDALMTKANAKDFECVQVITGNLRTWPDVDSLESLGQLVHVFGDVSIFGLELQSLHGLENLTKVGGSLDISGSKVSSLEPLHHLGEVGGDLFLAGMSATSLQGFESLREVGGDLTIANLDGITALGTFYSLSRIGGQFILQGNARLESADWGSTYAMSATVGDSIYVSANPALKKLSAFGQPKWPACDPLHPALPMLNISQNNALEEIVLPDLDGECVYISDNAQLSTISSTGFDAPTFLMLADLPALSQVQLPPFGLASLHVMQTGLETLNGFGPVRCELSVRDNPALSDISALVLPPPYGAKPGTMDVTFRVTDNPALAACQVQAIANSLPVPTESSCGTAPITRAVDIARNDDTAVCP
jgi:hypothetical protein